MNKFLVTAAMLLVFGTSAYMSIYGLTAVFTGAFILVVCMGAGMELGKVLTIVHLHRNWKRTRFFSKCFFIMVIGALTLITSAEIMGFLSQQHTDATRDLMATKSELKSLDQEAGQLRFQIAVIDQTLEGLPATFVTKRFREREAAGYTEKQNRVLEISRKQSELKTRYITNQAYSGPIFAASRIMNMDEQKTISIFILVLVFVLEPLSIGLTIATSSAWQIGRAAKTGQKAAGISAGIPAVSGGQKVAKTGNRLLLYEIKKAAKKTANILAGKPAETAKTINHELRVICKRYNLDAKKVAGITGRSKIKTVESWMRNDVAIPIKALRLLRNWVKNQPNIRMVSAGN